MVHSLTVDEGQQKASCLTPGYVEILIIQRPGNQLRSFIDRVIGPFSRPRGFVHTRLILTKISGLFFFLGPMTRTALDNALLLQATAGSDGIDDRQVNCPPTSMLPAYHTTLLTFSAKASPSNPKPLAGMKLGLLKEGLEVPFIDTAMVSAVKATVRRFEELGAEVVDVSVPEHGVLGSAVWHIMSHMGCANEVFEGKTNGRVGLQLTDLQEKMQGWDS